MTNFALHHGRKALSFAGTVRDRVSQPQELLPDPAALAAWLTAAELVPNAVVPSARSFASALELREAIARAARAVVEGRKPAARDIELLNDVTRKWNARPVLDPKSLTLVEETRDPVQAALGRIARDAIELFGNPEERGRLRSCGIDSCGSIFLTPPGRDRKWCSMERCGNRAKVAAFRARNAG